jgi:glycerol-3-phosphate acyltransferase PlsX
VIKSHGSADALAFANAIAVAAVVVRQQVPERISSQLQAILAERQAV